jgi:hypothetical protein
MLQQLGAVPSHTVVGRGGGIAAPWLAHGLLEHPQRAEMFCLDTHAGNELVAWFAGRGAAGTNLQHSRTVAEAPIRGRADGARVGVALGECGLAVGA